MYRHFVGNCLPSSGRKLSLNYCICLSDPAEGESIDWVYEALNVKNSFHIEVRPYVAPGAMPSLTGFLLDPEEIDPLCRETWAGIEEALVQIWSSSEPLLPEAAQELSCGYCLSIQYTIAVIFFCISILRNI